MNFCETCETPKLLIKEAQIGIVNEAKTTSQIPVDQQAPENGYNHGLRTPNEGINQRNLKIWADVADKICFTRT